MATLTRRDVGLRWHLGSRKGTKLTTLFDVILFIVHQDFRGRPASNTAKTGRGLHLELSPSHVTELRSIMQREHLRKIWVLVFAAACASAAQGQLDSTLGDVLGAIPPVIMIEVDFSEAAIHGYIPSTMLIRWPS